MKINVMNWQRVMKRLTDQILNLMGVAILLIAVLIGAGVLMNVFGISRLMSFDKAIWLIGRRITFNTLMGLQTLLFAFAVMITVSVAWYLDRQVRVDFFTKLSPRASRPW